MRQPASRWIDGRARIHLKVRAYVLGSITLRLADPLVVQSIVSYEHGHLFGIRVKNQNSVVINLPTAIPRDKVLTLMVTYAGRLEPQTPDRADTSASPDMATALSTTERTARGAVR